jgi:hypothetical protein
VFALITDKNYNKIKNHVPLKVKCNWYTVLMDYYVCSFLFFLTKVYVTVLYKGCLYSFKGYLLALDSVRVRRVVRKGKVVESN